MADYSSIMQKLGQLGLYPGNSDPDVPIEAAEPVQNLGRTVFTGQTTSRPQTIDRHDLLEVRQISGKGLGLVATTFIPAGTRILSEKVLWHVRHCQNRSNILNSFRSLPGAVQAEVDKLSCAAAEPKRWKFYEAHAVLHYTTYKAAKNLVQERSTVGEGLTEAEGQRSPHDAIAEEHAFVDESMIILRRFDTNAFEMDCKSKSDGTAESSGVFKLASRINHSCVPNAIYHIDSKAKHINVHAQFDIKPGEEVTVTYVKGTFALRKLRRERLKQIYGFSCTCRACDISTDFGRKSDIRRSLLIELEKAIRCDPRAPPRREFAIKGPFEYISASEKAIQLIKEEGMEGLESVYFLEGAAEIRCYLGHHKDAVKMEEKALELEGLCLGEDHEDVKITKQRLAYFRGKATKMR